MKIANYIKSVMQAEIDAIQTAIGFVDESTEKAASLIIECSGQLIVSGVGKSGIIGQKISGTFASTGTPSFFLHPTEALHGDLGKIREGDIILLLSYSGATDEVIALANLARHRDIFIMSITRSHQTELAKLSNISLVIGELKEACPHNLAPTSSSTATLALGDALALAVAYLRNFSADDFRKLHPGGQIGKLLMPVSSILRFRIGDNLDLIHESVTVQSALNRSSKFPRRSGAILTVDSNNKLSGVFTDADLRRMLVEHGPSTLEMKMKEVVTKSPHALKESALVRDAIALIKKYRIDELPIVNEAMEPVGLLDVQDLVTLGLITSEL